MSVELNQQTQQVQTNHRMDNVYEKFKKAHQNMSNFKELLTKFSTHRQVQAKHPQIQAFQVMQEPAIAYEPSLNLKLSEGWTYSGQTFEGKFHGYGILMYNDRAVYSGEFLCGRMHGKGKLRFHQSFQQLINIEIVDWIAYEGEFKHGQITGFGNLIMGDQNMICGFWSHGKPQYFTRVQSFNNNFN